MTSVALDVPPEMVEQIAMRAAELVQARGDDRWMTAKEAADYLALPVSTLHKLTAARAIPFEQDMAGGKLYFKRSALDRWREGN
jgi:excisionase family DNA binding protein